jgi:alpha-ketoglutarate-dependent taurine dioxygenase
VSTGAVHSPVRLACADTEEFIRTASYAIAEHKSLILTGGAPDGDHSAFYKKVADAAGDFHFKDENPDTGALDRSGWLDMRYKPELAQQHPYRYGNGRMALHTDGCYSDVEFDIIFFYCETPADFGGATTVIDGNIVVEYLERYDKELLAQLLETPIKFAKGTRSRTDYIISFVDGVPRFNWNATRVSPENPPESVQVAQRFHAFCENQLFDGGVVDQVQLARGDALFLHNRLNLHGRCSFWGPRHLMKGAITLLPEGV